MNINAYQSSGEEKGVPTEEIIETWKVMESEPASLRLMVEKDVDKYLYMDQHPLVITDEFMSGGGVPLTKEEVEEIGRNKEERMFFVVTEQGRSEFEGWVQFYKPSEFFLNNVRELGFKPKEDSLTLEVSYLRYMDPNVPEDERVRGLISSAVRQSCFAINMMLTQTDSPIALQKVEIIASVNPNNEASARVLERAGFKKLEGRVLWEPASKKLEDVWVLDWEELDKIYKDRTNFGIPQTANPKVITKFEI